MVIVVILLKWLVGGGSVRTTAGGATRGRPTRCAERARERLRMDPEPRKGLRPCAPRSPRRPDGNHTVPREAVVRLQEMTAGDTECTGNDSRGQRVHAWHVLGALYTLHLPQSNEGPRHDCIRPAVTWYGQEGAEATFRQGERQARWSAGWEGVAFPATGCLSSEAVTCGGQL